MEVDFLVWAGTLLFGLTNILLIPLSFYLCWDKAGRFSFIKYPLSYATKTKAKSLYTISLVFIAVVQILFITGVSIIYPSAQDVLIYGLFYLGMLFLALSGLVTSSYSRLLHRFFIIGMIFLITVWAFLYSIYLLGVSPYVGYTGILITVIATIGVPLLYLRTKSFGLSEILFATLTIIWNALFVFAILCIF